MLIIQTFQPFGKNKCNGRMTASIQYVNTVI